MDLVEWVAECCESYGWTVEYVLRMEAKRFFVMLDAARKLRAGRNQDLCDIATISLGNEEHYRGMRASFSRRWDSEREVLEAATQLEGDEAKNALKALFTG